MSRILAVASTPYQILVLLFLKDAFLKDDVVDLVVTDKTPSIEKMYKDGEFARFVEAHPEIFRRVLFADSRKIKNPYKGSLQNLWEGFVRNKTTEEMLDQELFLRDDESNPATAGDGAAEGKPATSTSRSGAYDALYFASPNLPDEVVKELIKSLILKNNKLEIYRYEDGFASYTKASVSAINTPLGQKLYRLLKGYDIKKMEKGMLLFAPEMAEAQVTMEKIQIPVTKERIEKVTALAKELFAFEAKVPEEEVIFLGQGTVNGMGNAETYRRLIRQVKELVDRQPSADTTDAVQDCITADHSGTAVDVADTTTASGTADTSHRNSNFILKPHPRGTHDDFGTEIATYRDDCPFELALSGGGFENKTIISFYSTGCVAGKLLFHSQCRIIFLYPLCEDAFNEKCDYAHYFETFSKTCDNVYVAKSWEDLEGLLLSQAPQ